MSAGRVSTATALFLAGGMLLTGSINTLSSKWADVTYSQGTSDWGDKSGNYNHLFTHPYFQTVNMFIGEFLCLAAFYLINSMQYRKNQNILSNNNTTAGGGGEIQLIEKASESFNMFYLMIPACCDLTATSMMNVGLTMTYASVFQMLRGSVVIFVGILSVVFLKRKLYAYNWLGMFLVLAGLILVGLASVVGSNSSSTSAPNALIGDLLVIAAQLIVSVQMVIEERILEKYSVPALQAVGTEGFWGFSIMSLLLVLFYYLPSIDPNLTDNDPHRLEDTLDAFEQMKNNYKLILAFIGSTLSIAFFNFFGVSVTKRMSATTRMVLDSIRTFVIWGVSLAIGWQEFQYLQVIGFIILLAGTSIYNKILPIPINYFDYRLTAEYNELYIDKSTESINNNSNGGKSEPLLNGNISSDIKVIVGNTNGNNSNGYSH